MAFSTYSELQSSVLDWIARPELTTQVIDFIRLAELEFEPTLRSKVVRDAITLVQSSDGVVDLPADVGEMRSVRLNTDTYQHAINLTTPEALTDYRRANSGVPRWGAIVDDQILVVPAPDADYAGEIIYFEKLTPLSNSNTTNSVLTDAPNVYLYGALEQAEIYLEHDERAAMWRDKLGKAIADLNLKREQAELAGAPRVMRLPRAIG